MAKTGNLTSNSSERYFGWIPVLTGVIRFTDALGRENKDKSLAKVYCFDSEQGEFDSEVNKKCFLKSDKRRIQVLVLVTHKDESYVVRRLNDLTGFLAQKHFEYASKGHLCLAKIVKLITSKILIKYFKTSVRSRIFGYLYDIKQSESSTGMSGEWRQLAYSPLLSIRPTKKFKTSFIKNNKDWMSNFSKYSYADNSNDVHEIASGTISISKFGFATFTLDKVNSKYAKNIKSDSVLNQVYYALKFIFHRHKYHPETSDAVIKPYKLAGCTALSYSQLNRVSQRLARGVMLLIGANTKTPELFRQARGYIAYLQAVRASIQMEMQQQNQHTEKDQTLPSAEGLAAVLNAIEAEESFHKNTANKITLILAFLGVQVALVATVFDGTENHLAGVYHKMSANLCTAGTVDKMNCEIGIASVCLPVWLILTGTLFNYFIMGRQLIPQWNWLAKVRNFVAKFRMTMLLKQN
ncbi:MAG: hypothetical protein QM533_11630 [Cytophagales bacterium]|nr:hypothetical protein [Cytophagales bacterium]